MLGYEGPNETMIRDARDALIEIGEDAVDELVDAVDSKNEQISINAIWILGELKDPRAIEPLIAALDNGNMENDALNALCRIGDISTIDVLSKYMDEEIVIKGGLVEINVKYIDPVIYGEGVDAAPYDPVKLGPHPVVIADEASFEVFRAAEGYHPDDPENWNALLPLDWQPLDDPESVELVLCWGEISEVTIDTAVYRGLSDSVKGERVCERRTVILREAATGDIIASETILGETPKKFPDSVSGSMDDFAYKGEWTAEILIDWLRPYVEGTA